MLAFLPKKYCSQKKSTGLASIYRSPLSTKKFLSMDLADPQKLIVYRARLLFIQALASGQQPTKLYHPLYQKKKKQVVSSSSAFACERKHMPTPPPLALVGEELNFAAEISIPKIPDTVEDDKELLVEMSRRDFITCIRGGAAYLNRDMDPATVPGLQRFLVHINYEPLEFKYRKIVWEYDISVCKTGGFDIKYRPLLPEGFRVIHPCTLDDYGHRGNDGKGGGFRMAAVEAVKCHNKKEGSNLVFVYAVKVNFLNMGELWLSACRYYITLKALDKSSMEMLTCQTVVVVSSSKYCVQPSDYSFKMEKFRIVPPKPYQDPRLTGKQRLPCDDPVDTVNSDDPWRTLDSDDEGDSRYIGCLDKSKNQNFDCRCFLWSERGTNGLLYEYEKFNRVPKPREIFLRGNIRPISLDHPYHHCRINMCARYAVEQQNAKDEGYYVTLAEIIRTNFCDSSPTQIIYFIVFSAFVSPAVYGIRRGLRVGRPQPYRTKVVFDNKTRAMDVKCFEEYPQFEDRLDISLDERPVVSFYDDDSGDSDDMTDDSGDSDDVTDD
ncbi:hypothetical protein Tsubulata_032633 [Turnera subulata]|uniref:Uncharacterized protein n=1 Tax=Turnera subulata TaxID=218843 RepID=A0A9Q0GM66_9ROSI|nr:hypothetical protein Tsubulata_032633 [Turnera subulata]